jgi:integrase
MTRVSGHVKLVKRQSQDRYYVKYRLPDGRQIQRCLGRAWKEKGRPPAGYFTRRMADEALQTILSDARRGTLEGMVKTGATFADAAAGWIRWIEHDRKRRPSTVKGYRSVMDHDLLPEFGELPLESITTEIVDAYRARLVAEGRLSARTINKQLTELHGIMARAQRTYGLRANPVSGVEHQPMRRSGDFKVLTPAQVEALVRASETEQDGALFTVAAFTGLRLGELLALRWRDIDFSKRLVHVRRNYTAEAVDTPKSGRVRSVPLIDRAARALDGLSRREYFLGDDDLVFGSEVGSFLDDHALRRRFYATLERAELEKIRLHDLRHTFGTLAVQAFPLSDVKAYMGHADIQTTMIYVHHVPRHDAAERLGRVISGSEDFVSRDVSRTEDFQENSSEPKKALASGATPS